MNNKTTSVYPLLYAGPVSFYAMWVAKPSCFDKHENFNKQSYRNRCRIFGANGIINLTIPIKKSTNKLPIQEVEISNIDPWQRIHWRSIFSSYKSSPFFEYYTHLWEPLFNKRYSYLWEFNRDIHLVVLECLQIENKCCFTSEFHPYVENDNRIIFNSKTKHYLSKTFPIYQQVFSYESPFEPDLSILDIIFNLGPEAENYLRNLKI